MAFGETTTGIIVLEKSGDFYQCYGEQAKIVSDALGMVLTYDSEKGSNLCGVPAHRIDHYVEYLKDLEIKVALEQ